MWFLILSITSITPTLPHTDYLILSGLISEIIELFNSLFSARVPSFPLPEILGFIIPVFQIYTWSWQSCSSPTRSFLLFSFCFMCFYCFSVEPALKWGRTAAFPSWTAKLTCYNYDDMMMMRGSRWSLRSWCWCDISITWWGLSSHDVTPVLQYFTFLVHQSQHWYLYWWRPTWLFI